MPGFGRRHANRRNAERVSAPFVALLIGTSRSTSVQLTNVSATGASLRAEGVAELGDEFFIRVEGLETFATVIWRRNGLCGVQFDRPLDAEGVERLRSEAEQATMTRLTPEERSALQDWRDGMAR